MKGTLYWVTGLSGSGKTTMSKFFYKAIKKNNKNTIFLDGDIMRGIMGLENKSFDKKSRLKLAMLYAKFAKLLTDQGIDVVFATISMFHAVRDWNKNNIKQYIEIYLKVPFSIIAKRDKNKLYSDASNKKKRNVVGVDIQIEEPKKPNIVLINDGSIPLKDLAQMLLKEVNKDKLKVGK